MRKKLLALFVVLCMVVGMVPAVLAANLEDYTDAEVAMYVEEETTLTETVEGLVVVTAPVKVTIDGAKLTAGIAILEEAAGAELDITGEANVNAVVVLGDATVTGSNNNELSPEVIELLKRKDAQIDSLLKEVSHLIDIISKSK